MNNIETAVAAALALMALPVAGQAQNGVVELDLSKMEPAARRRTSIRRGPGTARRRHGSSWRTQRQRAAVRSRRPVPTAQTIAFRSQSTSRSPLRTSRSRFASNRWPARSTRQAGSPVRLTTPDDYYVVRANALEDNVRFYRVVKGNRQQIAGANTKVASGEWHTLSLKAQGDRFTVSFDGKQLYTAEDRTFGNPGKVALWTKADSVTHFDRIAITPLQ